MACINKIELAIKIPKFTDLSKDWTFHFSNICFRYRHSSNVHVSSKWCFAFKRSASVALHIFTRGSWFYLFRTRRWRDKASEFNNKKKRGWWSLTRYISRWLWNGEGNSGKHVALEYELKSRGGSTPNIPHLITPLDTRDYIARIIG